MAVNAHGKRLWRVLAFNDAHEKSKIHMHINTHKKHYILRLHLLEFMKYSPEDGTN